MKSPRPTARVIALDATGSLAEGRAAGWRALSSLLVVVLVLICLIGGF